MFLLYDSMGVLFVLGSARLRLCCLLVLLLFDCRVCFVVVALCVACLVLCCVVNGRLSVISVFVVCFVCCLAAVVM